MADPWQLVLLRRSVPEWNAWRYAHPEVRADLSYANLSRADLTGAYLHRHLSGADLSEANLSAVDLSGADLSRANLSGAKWDTPLPLRLTRVSHPLSTGSAWSRHTETPS